MVVLADGPDLAPEAIDRVIARLAAQTGRRRRRDLRRHRASILCCSTRRVWQEIPDDGAKTLDAVLVCLRRSWTSRGTSISPMRCPRD